MQERISKIWFLVERQRYDDALEQISKAILADPDSAYLYTLQSELYDQIDQPDLAIESIKKAISYAPEEASAYELYSRYLFHIGEWDEALKIIDQAISLDPENGYFYARKALICYEDANYTEAVELAETAQKLDPDNEACTNILALVLTEAGDIEKSNKLVKAILENDPENIFSHVNYGFNYLVKGDVENAKKHFSEALRINPDYDFARRGMLEAMKQSSATYRAFTLSVGEKLLEKAGSKLLIWIPAVVGLFALSFITPIAFPFLFLVLAWTWYMPALSDIVLYFDTYGRNLMSEDKKQLTLINIWILIIAFLQLIIVAGIFKYNTVISSAIISFSIVPLQRVTIRSLPENQTAMFSYGLFYFGIGVLSSIKIITDGHSSDVDFFWYYLMLSMVFFAYNVNAHNK